MLMTLSQNYVIIFLQGEGRGSFFSNRGPKMEEKGPKADGREQKQKKWTKTPSQGDFFNVGFASSRVNILATNAVFLP